MKSFAVIGMGCFGRSLATTLCDMGHEVLCIDTSEDKVSDVADQVTHAIQADATDPAALRELGIRNFDAVVISIGTNLESCLLITLLCKELGCGKVFVKASNELHAKILSMIGADKVILPEKSIGVRVAHSLVSAGIMDFIELAPDYGLVEVSPPAVWHDKTLSALNLRAKFGITVIGIKHKNDIIVSPSADDVVHEGDALIIVGRNDSIARLENKHLEK